MTFDDKKIKQILLNENYIDEKDMKLAEELAKKEKLALKDALILGNFITKDLLGQAVAEFFKVAYADLNSYLPNKEQVEKIPESIAKKYNLVLFKEEKKTIIVATDNPTKKEAIKALKSLFKLKKIILNYSLTEDILAAFSYYRKTLDTRFDKIIKKQKRVAPEIIEEILNEALSFNASDIHFEPQADKVLVRFRIDGVLQEAGQLPKQYYENILNKIKVLANLRIDEHFSAQDGSIRFNKDNDIIDMRVSLVPTTEGEKVVIRLLSKYISGLNLANLGFLERERNLIDKASKKPFGMILVTGPTGSGKTTTLYSIIKTLNRPEVNITTIEDPVEYKIANINQIQVNQRTNLSFSQGLRTIVRQDPDIILVGEIRDQETSEIAVNAALTGHLLLSTFHSNNAATAIPRLLDMGIEPFLLASTLEVVVAQRLVRRLCESCRYGYLEKVSNLEKVIPGAKKYFKGKEATLYKTKGCSACGGLGYKGRIGIFEIIKVTPEMESLILKNPSSNEVWNLAQKQGAHSLFEDGIEKVKDGTTSLEELLRVSEAV